MTHSNELSATDFLPIHQETEPELIPRPSLSYWQDAWRRLKKNVRAIISLYLIAALAFFTLAGPIIWNVDPTLQDLNQIIIQGHPIRRFAAGQVAGKRLLRNRITIFAASIANFLISNPR